MNKRTTALTLGIALGLPLLPLTAADATGDPGAGFGSVSLAAVARGQEFLFSSTSQVPAQLSIPYASSNLQLGEGSGLATVGWPGATASSLGTTILLLAPQAPPQTQMLDYPVLARARSGAGDADVSNDTVPGVTMRATATKRKATAAAAADGTSALSTTAGATTAESAVELTGETSATGTASSAVRDVTFGVVHIGAVASTASGSTDGKRADARGSTTVSGVTVAGMPVTVDEDGVSAVGTSVVPAGATDPVTEALKQAQITLLLTKPVKTVRAGRVEYSTGSLVAITPLGTLSFGGAQLVLSATINDDTTSTPEVPDVSVPVPRPPASPPGSSPVVEQAGPVLPGPLDAAPSLPTPVVQPQAGRRVELGLISLQSGYGWAWIVSGLLLSFVAASGLLGLSRRWLSPDLSACPLERSAS